MEPPERIVHARKGRNALGEPGLAKPPLGFLELEEKIDHAGAAPRGGRVLPILPESLGDTLRRGCQGRLRGWKVDDRQGPRSAPWPAQVAHAAEHRQDVTHVGAGNRGTVTEPRLLAIPGACGFGPRRSGLPDRVCAFRPRDARRRGVARRPGAARPGRQPAGPAGAGRVAVRGPSAAGANPGGWAERRGRHPVPGTGAVRGAGLGCWAGIRDHHGQPAAVFVTRASP